MVISAYTSHHSLGKSKKKKKKNNHHVINQKLTFSPPPTINNASKKDQAPIYIDGPKMDWSMDDGLYSRFQDWQLECELILDGELTEIVEPQKVNTLIRWAGSFGLKTLKVWQKDKTNLTLTFIWNEFETHCKPHSNELRAWYELFKQLSQGTTPCDDWYTTVQIQLTMCNYKAETESVLQCDIFLFGLNDQTFISKIISEESPDVTAATTR